MNGERPDTPGSSLKRYADLVDQKRRQVAYDGKVAACEIKRYGSSNGKALHGWRDLVAKMKEFSHRYSAELVEEGFGLGRVCRHKKESAHKSFGSLGLPQEPGEESEESERDEGEEQRETDAEADEEEAEESNDYVDSYFNEESDVFGDGESAEYDGEAF